LCRRVCMRAGGALVCEPAGQNAARGQGSGDEDEG
jgi:hypothetical protein